MTPPTVHALTQEAVQRGREEVCWGDLMSKGHAAPGSEQDHYRRNRCDALT